MTVESEHLTILPELKQDDLVQVSVNSEPVLICKMWKTCSAEFWLRTLDTKWDTSMLNKASPGSWALLSLTSFGTPHTWTHANLETSTPTWPSYVGRHWPGQEILNEIRSLRNNLTTAITLVDLCVRKLDMGLTTEGSRTHWLSSLKWINRLLNNSNHCISGLSQLTCDGMPQSEENSSSKGT